MAPTLATACAALPPEGAVPPKGGLSAELVPTPTPACAALPPRGLFRLRAACRRNWSPRLPLRVLRCRPRWLDFAWGVAQTAGADRVSQADPL